MEYSAVVIVTQCRGERARDLLPEHHSLYVDQVWPIDNLWGFDGANKLIYSVAFQETYDLGLEKMLLAHS